jgi:aspartokinase
MKTKQTSLKTLARAIQTALNAYYRYDCAVEREHRNKERDRSRVVRGDDRERRNTAYQKAHEQHMIAKEITVAERQRIVSAIGLGKPNAVAEAQQFNAMLAKHRIAVSTVQPTFSVITRCFFL